MSPTTTSTVPGERLPVRVWDLPTRVFHWLLAAAVTGSLASAWIGGDVMAWHFRCGYVVFALLAFRLVWGLVGGRWSRFSSFVHRPTTTWRYVRGRSRPDEHHDVGHNPLGALSVLGLLGILMLQVGSGLVADDDISNTGPLVRFVSGATSSAMTRWHNTFGQWLIVFLAVLHVGAIAWYLLRLKTDLVRPMWHGDKALGLDVPAADDGWRARGLALLLILACAAGVGWVVGLGG